VRRERHGDPNDVVFAPLQQLLETGGLEAWEPPAPVDPEPRVPSPPVPLFAGLPPRKEGAPSLVTPPVPPRSGWHWLPPSPEANETIRGWRDLPVVATLGPLEVRWAGPLVDAGRAGLLATYEQQVTYDSDLGQPRWPDCDFQNDDGAVHPRWARALLAGARELARRHSGGDEEWLAWLCFTLSEPCRALKERAATPGAQG
jgi:hypothetical protein